MRHYVAVYTLEDTGDWCVRFPDVPGCEVKGLCFEDIQLAAPRVLSGCLADLAGHTPSPTDDAAWRNNAWLAENHIDMSTAVMTMVAVP